jgi:hypothetical protein
MQILINVIVTDKLCTYILLKSVIGIALSVANVAICDFFSWLATDIGFWRFFWKKKNGLLQTFFYDFLKIQVTNCVREILVTFENQSSIIYWFLLRYTVIIYKFTQGNLGAKKIARRWTYFCNRHSLHDLSQCPPTNYFCHVSFMKLSISCLYGSSELGSLLSIVFIKYFESDFLEKSCDILSTCQS